MSHVRRFIRPGVYTGVDEATMTISFEEWLVETRPRLHRCFLARYGSAIAVELTSEVVAWAWEHRSEIDAMDNPSGYLYRVGQSKSRRLLRWRRSVVTLPEERRGDQHDPVVEPGLDTALASLSAEQREAVILVHCFGWTQPEVADMLEVELHTVRNRVHRGLISLRESLGVTG